MTADILTYNLNRTLVQMISQKSIIIIIITFLLTNLIKSLINPLTPLTGLVF